MNLNLNDKIVLIVGASKGIGLSIVKAFLGQGAIVHAVYRNKNEILEKSLKSKYDRKFFFHHCDATDSSDLKKCCSQIRKIDILISNVGNGRFPNDPINNLELWNESWKINFESALNSVSVFSEIMREGSILFISSIAGNEFINAPTDYSVAKSSIISLTKMLSHKLAPKIRINTISPGNIFIKNGTWDIISKNKPDFVNDLLNNKVPLKRFGMPEEVADLALFISSERSSFITGSCFIIDGGQTVSF